MRIRLGDLLVKAGVIDDDHLKAALAEQAQWGGKLGDILVRMQFLTEDVLVRALAKQTGFQRADLTGEGVPEALEKLPADVAEEFGVVPVGLEDEGRTLVVAMSDPLNIMVSDQLRSVTGCRLVPQIAGTSSIRDAIARWYRGEALASENEPENSGVRITDNAGDVVVTVPSGRSQGPPPPNHVSAPPVSAPPVAPPPSRISRPAAPIQPAASRSPASPELRPGPAQMGPQQPGAGSGVEVLRGVEDTQRRSVAALKAMVELLIEKGVFSRDEYLARVRR
jgi:hypothetical protein